MRDEGNFQDVLKNNLSPCYKCGGARYEKSENEREILYLGCSHCYGMGLIDWIDNILGVNIEQMNSYLRTSDYKELLIPCTSSKKLEKTLKIKNFQACMIRFNTDILNFFNSSKIIFENCSHFLIREVKFVDMRSNGVGPLISIIGKKENGKRKFI